MIPSAITTTTTRWRSAYARAGSPRVVEAIWASVEAKLPAAPPDEHPLGCHRRRIPDRDCFVGILCRLVTGCSWDLAGRLGKASETTLRRRRDEWLQAGVFDHVANEAIAAYDRVVGLDLAGVALDSSQHKAPMGGEGTGPNQTDRAKSGWKWSLATDRWGIPIGWSTDGAQRNDVMLVAPTLDAIAARGLLADIETLHMDRGYDNARVQLACSERGLSDVVCPKRRPAGTAAQPIRVPLGMRWPVEGTTYWRALTKSIASKSADTELFDAMLGACPALRRRT